MLVACSRRICRSRLLSLRSLVTETASSAPAEEPSASTPRAAVQESAGTVCGLLMRSLACSTLLTGPLAAGQQEARKPAWWSDPKVDAIHAYNIIHKRFKLHGPQRESATCSTLVSIVTSLHIHGNLADNVEQNCPAVLNALLAWAMTAQPRLLLLRVVVTCR